MTNDEEYGIMVHDRITPNPKTCVLSVVVLKYIASLVIERHLVGL